MEPRWDFFRTNFSTRDEENLGGNSMDFLRTFSLQIITAGKSNGTEMGLFPYKFLVKGRGKLGGKFYGFSSDFLFVDHQSKLGLSGIRLHI